MYTDGIIFDVDGTLWDSTPLVAGAWTRAVEECGYKGRTVTAEQLKQLFGRTMTAIAQGLFPDLSGEEQTCILDKCCVYEEEVLANNESDICYPQVRQILRTLALKYRLFIVSNCQSGYIELFLQKTGLGDVICDIECYGNTGRGKGKNIRLLADRNDLKAPVYVGDTQGDCDASKEAGIPFIFASYGFGNADSYEAAIDSLSALLDIVDRLER